MVPAGVDPPGFGVQQDHLVVENARKGVRRHPGRGRPGPVPGAGGVPFQGPGFAVAAAVVGTGIKEGRHQHPPVPGPAQGVGIGSQTEPVLHEVHIGPRRSQPVSQEPNQAVRGGVREKQHVYRAPLHHRTLGRTVGFPGAETCRQRVRLGTGASPQELKFPAEDLGHAGVVDYQHVVGILGRTGEVVGSRDHHRIVHDHELVVHQPRVPAIQAHAVVDHRDARILERLEIRHRRGVHGTFVAHDADLDSAVVGGHQGVHHVPAVDAVDAQIDPGGGLMHPPEIDRGQIHVALGREKAGYPRVHASGEIGLKGRPDQYQPDPQRRHGSRIPVSNASARLYTPNHRKRRGRVVRRRTHRAASPLTKATPKAPTVSGVKVSEPCNSLSPQAPAINGAPIRNEKKKGLFRSQPKVQGGGDGGAAAGDPGQQGRHLGQADQESAPGRQRTFGSPLPPERKQHQAVQQEGEGQDAGMAEHRIHRIFQQEPGQAGGHHPQHPRHKERSIPERPKPGRRKIDPHGQQGSAVQKHLKVGPVRADVEPSTG